jgi:phosphoglycolate phosphatase-like HAD superfamily hydrolase
MKQAKGLIFDLDGTLADTLPLCLISFQDAIENISGKRPSKESVEKFWGYSEIGIVKNLYPQDWKMCFEEFLKVYKKNHPMCCELFGGMKETLELLRKNSIKIALVTGKGKDSCAITLEELGIAEYFEIIETGSEIGSIKPDCIKKILDIWELEPQEVYYIGDAVSDIKDCKKVNVKCISAAWAKTAHVELLKKEKPALILYSIEDFHLWTCKNLINK